MAATDSAAKTGTLQDNLQQPSQQYAEPSQGARSCAEGGALAAGSVNRVAQCPLPEAAEEGSLLCSAPVSPLPGPAQEAPPATSGLQDMLGLLLPPVPNAAGHTLAPQQLSRANHTSKAVQTGPTAAEARQPGAEQRQEELPAPTPQPHLQRPRPQPRPRQAEVRAGTPSSSVPSTLAGVPGDELRPKDECLVCLAALRCIMLAPCGHMPYCLECAERLCGPKGIHARDRGHVCPLCQEPVRATVSRTFSIECWTAGNASDRDMPT